MDAHPCDRCFQREPIPTHQMVKFDDRAQFLCRDCWEEFRRWFHWGQTQCDHSHQLELF